MKGNLILDQRLRSAASEAHTFMPHKHTHTDKELTGADFYLIHTGEDGHDPAQHCRTNTGNMHKRTLRIQWRLFINKTAADE